MENWTQRIFLKAALVACFVASSSQTYAQDKPLIEPDVKPQVVDEALIDTENFEVGTFVGVMNIEDFGSSLLYGARISYHLSEGLFFEANYGQSDGGKTSFEKLGNVDLISDRTYSYYNVNVGYNLLPGQAFVGGKYAFNTNFYLVGGAGSTKFGQDSHFTANFGAGYQVLLNDWLALNISAREHLYRTDITGEDKLVFNSELSTGISIFF